MPSRTRTRALKVLKENVEVIKKTKVKEDGKVTKPPRKALADKTNSLSDDNESIDVPIKKTKTNSGNKAAKTTTDNIRPRRDRKLPSRFVENQVLNNLSNSNNTPVKELASSITTTNTSSTKPLPRKEKKQKLVKNEKLEIPASRPKRNCRLQSVKEAPAANNPETPSKNNHNENVKHFKPPLQNLDTSLITNRPKRIHRLPSRFEDHSISPSKFIPVQPCHASTPIAPKNLKPKVDKSEENISEKDKKNDLKIKVKDTKDTKLKNTKGIDHYFSKSKGKTVNTLCSPKGKNSPDTNNNPKRGPVYTKIKTKQVSPKAKTETALKKRILENSLSFRVFEDKKESNNNKDVYEFTFDPNEEPQPKKKKRKKPVNKKPPKPKIVVLKNNYDQNVAKALESLRSKVNKPEAINNQKQPIAQASNTEVKTQYQNGQSITQHQETQVPQNIKPLNAQTKTKPINAQSTPQNLQTTNNIPGKVQILENIVLKPASEKTLNYSAPDESVKNSVHMSNYASIRIEDIAADFEPDPIDNGINYSPIPSPCQPKTHVVQESNNISTVNNKDPLSLQGESFFDDHPVASSSMNVSVRHPLASPWRVEFSNLPIKWQADTYLKPNMTPAVESSFINPDEPQKKHVYTNLIANNDPLPFVEDPPQLKQTSIISFLRECAEKSLKKRRRSVTPKKVNSLFEDTQHTNDFGDKTHKKARKENLLYSHNVSNSSNKSHKKDNYNHNHISDNKYTPNENESDHNSSVKKSNKIDKDGTLFGFDDSEDIDQENVSPVKIQNTRARDLRAKSRAVLKEINTLSGPSRVVLPMSKAMLASSDAVNQVYDQLKSAEGAPLFPENKKASKKPPETNVDEINEDDESVHLFEDIELIHYLKPQRKSYGKAKKVTFQQRSSDSDSNSVVLGERTSDEEDLDDLDFQMPNIRQKKVKKKKPKKQLSKKEEKEVEAWAAGFNSMCEDIDEFPLVVE